MTAGLEFGIGVVIFRMIRSAKRMPHVSCMNVARLCDARLTPTDQSSSLYISDSLFVNA